MTKIVPNDLLNPTEKTIKNWNCSFIAVEGPNVLDKLSLEDLEIPYESQYRSRVVLKAGETDQPLIYGFIGKAVTFLMIKVTYDSENDPYYKYEQETYNINYYFENDTTLRPINRLMILTGSEDDTIPQIYLNNPLGYDVILDVLHATTDAEYNLTGHTHTSSSVEIVDIPTLKLDTGYYTNSAITGSYTDTIRCYWESNNTKFLEYNPEVWVFRRKNYIREKDIDDSKIRHKKWTHEPHLNGSKYPNSSYYSGSINSPIQEIETNGRHTEFDSVPTGTSYKTVIPLDPYEYIFGDLGNGLEKLSDSTDFSKITRIKVTGRRNSKSLPFRFAIVIDNPDTSSSNPKIIGDLSDIVYLRYDNQNGECYIKYAWNEISIDMFKSGRFD